MIKRFKTILVYFEKMNEIVKKIRFPFAKFIDKWKSTKRIENGDIFKAVSQCLEQIETLNVYPTAQKLRNMCYNYAVENEWVKLEVIKNGYLDPFYMNSDDSTLWNDYLLSLKSGENVTAKSEMKIESQIISQLFNLEFHVLLVKSSADEIDWLNGQIVKINHNSTRKNVIHLVNFENRKFEAQLKIHCCSLKEAKFVLNNKLDEFVTRFVREFEAKMTSYVMISENEIAKSGKFSELYSTKISQVSNGIFEYSVGSHTFRKNHARSDGDTCNVANLSEFINYFVKNRLQFRKVLVEVGVDIFQSFEMQLGRVSSDFGEKLALQLLARDAMNRAVLRIAQGPSDVIINLHSIILEGVKFGKSNKEPFSSGYSIKYEFCGIARDWNTSQMFENAGLLMFDDFDQVYYKQKLSENNKENYGCRRSFIYDYWGDLRTNFISKSEKMEKFSEYVYIFSPVEMKQKADDLFIKIECADDWILEENRLIEIILESKNEILDELETIKTISDKLGNDSMVLNNIETNLKNLKINEYVNKFQSKAKIKIENDGNAPTFMKICKKMDEQNVCLKSKSDRHSVEFTKSVWFNIKTPLNSFTRLISIGNEIEGELNRGSVVVIHGPSGVGKSELATKFANFKYKEVDNVIWINCDAFETVANSCKQLAQMLNLDSEDEKLGRRNLSKLIDKIYSVIFNRKCLLILDNADNYESVEVFLKLIPKYKSRKPHLIITSRNDFDWENNVVCIKIIPLTNFTQSQAVKFIKLALSIENDEQNDDAVHLTGILKGFPFTMQIAVNYIKNVNKSLKRQNFDFAIKNYLLMYESNYKYLSENNPYFDCDQIRSSVFTVLAIKLNDLQNQVSGEKALHLLRMLAFFPSNNIPKIIFFSDENNSNKSTIDVLKNYFLLNNQGKFLHVHSLIQQAIREILPEAEEKKVLGNVLKLIIKRIKYQDKENYDQEIVSVLNYAIKHEDLIENLINSYISTDIMAHFLRAIVSRNQFEILWKIIYKIGVNHENLLADVLNSEDKFGNRLIHSAVKNPLMIRLLIEKKAIVNVSNSNQTTPLHFSAIQGEIEVTKILIENGHYVNPINKNRLTPLIYAIENSHVEIVKYLLDNGANANLSSSNLSPLHLAISQNNLEIVEALLRHKSVNVDAGGEMTPLRMAITHAQTDLVRALLRKGCECNARFVYNFTPLIYACIKNLDAIVQVLLEREDVDVNAQMFDGNSALHAAVYMENLTILRLFLLDSRVNKDIVNNDGKTAFDIASQFIQNYICQFKD